MKKKLSSIVKKLTLGHWCIGDVMVNKLAEGEVEEREASRGAFPILVDGGTDATSAGQRLPVLRFAEAHHSCNITRKANSIPAA